MTATLLAPAHVPPGAHPSAPAYVHPSVGPFRAAFADRPEWGPADLAGLARLIAAGSQDALRFEAVHDPAERWYLRLALTGQVEVWLLGWAPGQATRPHHHGGAAGAYTVLDGELTETWRDGPVRSRRAVRSAGGGSAFGRERVHQVANDGLEDATSVHVYSPPLLPLGTDVVLEDPA